jgi:hypothetical protein
MLDGESTTWFKYDRDYLCVNKSQFVPVIFEPPCKYCLLKATASWDDIHQDYLNRTHFWAC